MGRRNTPRRTGAGLVSVSSEPHLEGSCAYRGFPPGTTVDELRWYSRRKVDNASYKTDNLFLESGSLKDVTSEYTRCFKAPPLATYSLGDLTDEPNRNVAIRRFSSQSEDMINKYRTSEPGLGSNRWHRPSREQNLKLEGEMLFKTENADEFIEYVLGKRPDLLRRQTQLKLEGDMDSLTENREKYIAFENCQRPPLAKRNTNLHLEGDHTYAPEYREIFVEFPRKRPTVKRPNAWLKLDSGAKMSSDSETLSQFVQHIMTGGVARSEILRRPSNLKCEGDIALLPEYRDSFREHPACERQSAIKQLPTLRLEGQLYTMPEYRDKFTTFQHAREKPVKPFDALQLGDENDPLADLMKSDDHPLNLATESGLNVSTDNTAITAKPPPTPPTKTLKSDSLKSNKPDHTSYKKYSPTIYTKTKPNTHSDTVLEDRLAAKPPRSSRTRTPSRASQIKRDHQFQRSETPKRYTEKTYDIANRQPSTCRWTRQSCSKPDENPNESLESKPEYRKAYLDYLIRERLPNRFTDEPEEKNADSQQNEELTTNRVSKKISSEERKMSGDNNNLAIYQPTTRRASASSIHSSPRRRSASPSYKMQVTNVDEPKKGFGSKEFTSHRPQAIDYISNGEGFKNSNRSNWIRSVAQNNQEFGYENKDFSNNNKSFVVLDNDREKFKTNRRKWESPWWQSTYN